MNYSNNNNKESVITECQIGIKWIIIRMINNSERNKCTCIRMTDGNNAKSLVIYLSKGRYWIWLWFCKQMETILSDKTILHKWTIIIIMEVIWYLDAIINWGQCKYQWIVSYYQNSVTLMDQLPSHGRDRSQQIYWTRCNKYLFFLHSWYLFEYCLYLIIVLHFLFLILMYMLYWL